MLADLQSIAHIAQVLVSIIVSFVSVAAYFRATGKIDLDKTMEAAKDAAAEIKKLKDQGHIRDAAEAGKRAISLVEGIRGKKLNSKLARKAKSRVLSIMDGKDS